MMNDGTVLLALLVHYRDHRHYHESRSIYPVFHYIRIFSLTHTHVHMHKTLLRR